LVMDKGRMAKSSGEILTVDVLIKNGYSPLDYRYLCLNTHYKTPLTFSYDALDAARSAYDSLKSKIIELRKDESEIENHDAMHKYKSEFLEAVNDDLNIPKALGLAWTMLKDKELKDREKYELMIAFDKVLGLDLENAVTEIVDVQKR